MPIWGVLSLLFLGEGLMIRAEIAGARVGVSFRELRTIQQSLILGALLLGSMCLLLGYVRGYQQLENIRIIAAVSLGSILIIEPLLARTIFHEIPTKGAVVGLGCGIVGICFSLRW